MPQHNYPNPPRWLIAGLIGALIFAVAIGNRATAQPGGEPAPLAGEIAGKIAGDEGAVTVAPSSANTSGTAAGDWFPAGPVDDVRAALDPAKEILAKRSANTKHYDLGNGQVLAIVTPRPLHFRDPATGEWRDIDAVAVGTNNVTGNVFANDTNALRSRFSADSARGVSLAHAAGDLLAMWIDPMISVRAANGQVIELVPADLSAPTVAENIVTYANSHAEGRTEFCIGRGFVKMDVLFEVPPAAANGLAVGRVEVAETLQLAPGLALRANGATLVAGGSAKTKGRVTIVDANGETVASIAAPLIRDAMGVVDATAIYAIEVGADGRVRFTLTGAAEWLTDAARAFPVSYDPTVEILASEDTFITEDSPNATHGTDTLLQIRGSTTGARARALLKFSGVDTNNFATTIFEARFHAYCESVGVTGSSYKMGVWDVTGPWNANSTWNTFANAIAGSLADLTISTSGWYTFASASLTSYVETWRTDANARDRGLAMSYELNTSHNFSSVWRSADYSGTYHDPFLSIVYDNAVGVNLYDDGEIYRSFFPRTLYPGDAIQVFCDVRNGGTSPSGAFSVDFYASSNSTITTADYYLGSVRMASINGGAWADCNLNLGAVPSFIPTGVYYVGWIIDSGAEVAETNETDNTAYKVGYFLTVDFRFSSRCGMTLDSGPGREWAMIALLMVILVPLAVLRRRRALAGSKPAMKLARVRACESRPPTRGLPRE